MASVSTESQEIVQKNSKLSMHPRVVNGRTVHTKVNTCESYKGGGKLAKKMKNLNRRRLDHSATLKNLPSNVNPSSYRTPGSMNRSK